MKIALRDAISKIKSNDTVFIQGGAATPTALIQELVSQSNRLVDVELIHLHLEGNQDFASKEHHKSFKVCNLFIGAEMRKFIDYNRVDYLPCFLSEMPKLFKEGIKKIDVALIHVSPPDRLGFCSLGLSVDITKAALESAKVVIAQVNPNMPRVHGSAFIAFKEIDYWCEVDDLIPECKVHSLSVDELKIGQNVAAIIPDRATLQMGIGSIPDAVLAGLHQHKDLGIHSEMWSDGALELILSGVVNNKFKKVHPGKTLSCFIMGSKKVYNYVNDNPTVVLYEADYVNSPATIARNKKVVAINSAVEIDLTGQICADSIGSKIISGVGGQMDFMRGSALSEGGLPIIALLSRTLKGQSRLVSQLKQGAGVVTTRANVHYVATEYGIVNLFGRTLGERAKLLISIAHPEDRENLEQQIKKAR